MATGGRSPPVARSKEILRHYCLHKQCIRGDTTKKFGKEEVSLFYTDSSREMMDHISHHHVGVSYECSLCTPPPFRACTINEFMSHLENRHPEYPRHDSRLLTPNMTEQEHVACWNHWRDNVGHFPSPDQHECDSEDSETNQKSEHMHKNPYLEAFIASEKGKSEPNPHMTRVIADEFSRSSRRRQQELATRIGTGHGVSVGTQYVPQLQPGQTMRFTATGRGIPILPGNGVEGRGIGDRDDPVHEFIFSCQIDSAPSTSGRAAADRRALAAGRLPGPGEGGISIGGGATASGAQATGATGIYGPSEATSSSAIQRSQSVTSLNGTANGTGSNEEMMLRECRGEGGNDAEGFSADDGVVRSNSLGTNRSLRAGLHGTSSRIITGYRGRARGLLRESLRRAQDQRSGQEGGQNQESPSPESEEEW